jgi:hypothetical protein
MHTMNTKETAIAVMMRRNTAPYRRATLIVGVFTTLLMLASCSSDKTGVGGGLLNDIGGQSTQRDTLVLSLTDQSVLKKANFSLHIPNNTSQSLLIGEANGIKATTLLRFDSLQLLYDIRLNFTEDGEDISDTLTLTPKAIYADTPAYMQITFWGYPTDSGDVFLEGHIIQNDWNADDSVQTPPPLPSNGTALFGPDTLHNYIDGQAVPVSVMEIAHPEQLGNIIGDSLSIRIQATLGSKMAEIPSINSYTTYSPRLIVWVTAEITSSRYPEAAYDTLLAYTVQTTTDDCYRIERTSPMPAPTVTQPLLASGAGWRAFFRIPNTDTLIPPSADSVARSRATVNSAILQVTLADEETGPYTFQRPETKVELYALLQEFDYDTASVNQLAAWGSRLTWAGFDVAQDGGTSTDSLRTFEISDIANYWWQNPDQNYGFFLKVANEFNNVNAVEITGMKLILITTTPPVLTKPAPADTTTKEAGK